MKIVEIGHDILNRQITGEAFAVTPDIGRCELIAGNIMPRPYHTVAESAFISNLCFSIEKFGRNSGLGTTLVGGCGIYTRTNPDTVRGMDIAYYSADCWNNDEDTDDYLSLPPDLIVEVPSTTDSFQTVMTKLREYFAIGVQLVWVADTEANIVYAYRSPTDVREFKEGEQLPGDEVLAGFSVAVRELFG